MAFIETLAIGSKTPIFGNDRPILNAMRWLTPDGEEVYAGIEKADKNGYEFIGYDAVLGSIISNVFDFSIYTFPDKKGVFSRCSPKDMRVNDTLPYDGSPINPAKTEPAFRDAYTNY